MTAVTISANTVTRPVGVWTPSIHAFLNHLSAQAFEGAPTVVSLSHRCEVLSLVEGQTYNYPLVGEIASDQVLRSAARLQRRLHDASMSFINQFPVSEMSWMLEVDLPGEVMCHGDFAPYNVALTDGAVAGVFDFDTLHPGTRVWDLAYSVYCWAPFKTNKIDRLGSLTQQALRAKSYCDAYELDTGGRLQLVDMMVRRLHYLVDFMRSSADAGNEDMQRCIAEGHMESYLQDIDYLHKHRDVIHQVLTR
ncbi:phosphotransferase enzyme family protein [Vibrio hangzhouensis]|uniref:phosphotransferase enzyme family protein n=1 Tax=Vibrio hangzhouensis TaxID=462991 RepID=UPI001C97069D|nr:phosphotransferase [Vibrio hangzhouensis]MBY6196648.1 phosphotransferase [Vibrio hangzhouensis]